MTNNNSNKKNSKTTPTQQRIAIATRANSKTASKQFKDYEIKTIRTTTSTSTYTTTRKIRQQSIQQTSTT
jgi:nicotinic acid mononucleotide adenylyltransferase